MVYFLTYYIYFIIGSFSHILIDLSNLMAMPNSLRNCILPSSEFIQQLSSHYKYMIQSSIVLPLFSLTSEKY
jgi:hypothetical protein